MVDIFTVIAFDPGETTGWCVMRVQPEVLEHAETELHESLFECRFGQINCQTVDFAKGEMIVQQHAGLNISGENDGVLQMIDLVDKYPGSVVILEDFILDPRKATKSRDLLSPVRIISSFSFGMFCQELEAKIFIQNRSPVKTTCTDERLKTWGLYDRQSGPHARDAVRHAIYFLRSCQGSYFKAKESRWRAWPQYYSDPMVRSAKKVRQGGARIPGLG